MRNARSIAVGILGCASVLLLADAAWAQQDLAGASASPTTTCSNDEPCIAPRPLPAPAMTPARRGALLPLYSGFGLLQGLDVYSTERAINHGAVEANPMLSNMTNPLALSLVKAGVTVSTLYAVDHVHRRHHANAIVMMTVLDSAYVAIVVHNYRLVR